MEIIRPKLEELNGEGDSIGGAEVGRPWEIAAETNCTFNGSYGSKAEFLIFSI